MGMNRRDFVLSASAALAAAPQQIIGASAPQHRVMLMSRIGPTASDLFIAGMDGTNDRRLLETPGFDFHASFSSDGSQVLFTSERRGRGQADICIAHADGTGIRSLVTGAAVDDVAALSADGARLAFVSTRGTGRANIWIQDIRTGRLTNLTGRSVIQGDPDLPDGFFRPSWSPDGRWLAFSSDRNTAWKGHACTPGTTSCPSTGEGWEHIQQLSIYVMHADGQGLRVLASRPGYSAGSPKWSADGRRVIFYEMPVQDSWNARISFLAARAQSQVVSVDVNTGERIEHTSGPGLKLFPQFISTNEIGYQIKVGAEQGLHYTSGRPAVKGAIRSPVWSPDGTRVVYEKTGFTALPQNTLLHSWDPQFEYRSTDSFPRLSQDNKLVLTEQASNSSIAIMNPDGTDRRRVFDTEGKGLAFGPCWSPDGQWIVFGFGLYFENRYKAPSKIMRVRRDGSGLEVLFEGPENAGFPSCAPDGKRIVFRLTAPDGQSGLRILDLTTRVVSVLTNEYDNLPDWSPEGGRIVFTRRLGDGNFDVFTIRPDGGGLRRLTTSGANDAHAVWTTDGRLLWNSGLNGFKDEAPLYDSNFQPYGQIWIMNADGSGKRALTDSLWEDSQPLYLL